MESPSLLINCPASILVSPTKTVVSVASFNPDGSPLCVPNLTLTNPDSSQVTLQAANCQNGVSQFNADVPSRGMYNATASQNGQKVACSFSAVGSPPRPVDEIPPAITLGILAIIGGLLAFKSNTPK